MCGVMCIPTSCAILFGWFLRVPSPHALVSIRKIFLQLVPARVSYSLQRGWPGSLPPPQNLEIEYSYYCGTINISYIILHVTEHTYVPSKCCLEVCPRLHQKQSERI